jgi:hypothetical protein
VARHPRAAGRLALPTLANADADYLSSSAVRKIDADRARGVISASQAAREKLFYLFDRSRLAPEYAIEGTRPAKCGTAILADLAARRNELDADTRALYDQMVVQGGGGNEINLAHTVETTHFSITYQDAGTSAVPLADVAPANGIPDFIEWVMDACEHSWRTEIDTLGFLPPVLTRWAEQQISDHVPGPRTRTASPHRSRAGARASRSTRTTSAFRRTTIPTAIRSARYA